MTRTSRTSGSVVFHASASRSPKCERTQSAMNWLGMTTSSDAAVRIEIAEPGGLQPAVERSGAKVTAKSGPDRVPGGLERCSNLPFDPLLARVRTLPCTGPRLLTSPMRKRQKGTVATDASRVAQGCFSLLPPGADSRPERLFWEPTAADSSANFHRNEIISLDSANAGTFALKWRKTAIFMVTYALTIARIAGIAAFF